MSSLIGGDSQTCQKQENLWKLRTRKREMMQSQHSHPGADEQVWLDFRCFHVGGLLMFIRHQLKWFSFPRRSELSANRLAWINLKWEEICFYFKIWDIRNYWSEMHANF